MPSNKKKGCSNNKKNNKKKTGKTETGFHPGNNLCSFCNREGTADAPLLTCGRCGAVAYCGPECQKAAHPEHKGWCIQTAEDAPRDDNKGMGRLLFSRCFGGAVSLFLHYHREVVPRQPEGIILVRCSHRLAEFCGRRRTEEKRSVTLSYVPEGEQLLSLQQEALGPAQARRDDGGPGWLELIHQQQKTMARDLTRNFGDQAFYNRACVVALQQPGVQQLRTVIFITYTGSEHPCHAGFQATIEDRRYSPGAADDRSKSVTLDWDWDTSSRNRQSGPDDVEYPMQWLFHNAIGPNFYRQCSLAWQEKKRNRDPSPWPNGVLTPPLALEVNLTAVPPPDAAASSSK